MRKSSWMIVVLIGWAISPLSFASGGHYLVDDYASGAPGVVGLETWYEDAGTGANTGVIQPTYGFRNGPALTLVVQSTATGGGREQAYGLEAAGMWQEPEAGDPFGLGWVVGSAYDAKGGLEEVFAYLPATFSLVDDRWLLHVNAGWVEDRSGTVREGHAFHGLGSQFLVGRNVEFIGEVFVPDAGETVAQAGFRLKWTDRPGQLDLSYARRLERGREDWVTLGFAWAF